MLAPVIDCSPVVTTFPRSTCEAPLIVKLVSVAVLPIVTVPVPASRLNALVPVPTTVPVKLMLPSVVTEVAGAPRPTAPLKLIGPAVPGSYTNQTLPTKRMV